MLPDVPRPCEYIYRLACVSFSLIFDDVPGIFALLETNRLEADASTTGVLPALELKMSIIYSDR